LSRDDHPKPVTGRVEAEKFLELAHLVDAGMGRRVYLDHVDARALRHLATGIALATRLGGRALGAVDRLGQQAGGRRLANAPKSREEIGLTEGFGGQCVAQGLDDSILPEELGESLRSPGARENLIGHPGILLDPFPYPSPFRFPTVRQTEIWRDWG
jgi:hypothetical protein